MLSEQLKKWRTARGISQVELARAMSVSKQSISNWENNNIQPSVDLLIQLADFFGVSADEMLGRSDRAVLDVSGLTSAQIQHLSLLVSDLRGETQSPERLHL